MTGRKNALAALLLCALAGCIQVPPVADMSAAVTSPSLYGAGPSSATVPFRLDDNRIFVAVAFRRPDGTARKALAMVNMGAGALVLSNALFRELAPLPGKPLRMTFGAMNIAIDGAAVQPESMANSMSIGFTSTPPSAAAMARGPGGLMAEFADPLPVEAMIPPGLLQHFVVSYDYAARSMTLAVPGGPKPAGIAVPVRIDSRTGFATVDVAIDGARHAFVLDNGGSYGLVRDASTWTDRHPGWRRSVGGVGEANYLMNGGEAGAAVVKLRDAALGPLRLDELGVVETKAGGPLGGLVSDLFWDRIYAPKAGEAVEGAIGGNVLKSFRFTVDYPNRTSYWLQQAPLDIRDLDQVGITLVRAKGTTAIAGVAEKNGKPTVEGVAAGDILLKIDDLAAAGSTRGQLLAALHGVPGTAKHLTLERDGRQFTVDAPVTAF